MAEQNTEYWESRIREAFSTTFEPIKPLDPVTRIRSAAKAIYSELIPLADFSL